MIENNFDKIMFEYETNARLIKAHCAKPLKDAIFLCSEALKHKKKIYLFGNGGSAADAQHIAAEFVVKLYKKRRAYSAIALTTDSSVLTAIGNDFSFDNIFQRQIEAHGSPGDIAIGYSTSGLSTDVINGLMQAKFQEMHTICFTGPIDNTPVCGWSDIQIHAPGTSPSRIQEGHIVLGHILVDGVEKTLNE